jgi:hypothetical protein
MPWIDGWFTWSISTRRTLGSYSLPSRSARLHPSGLDPLHALGQIVWRFSTAGENLFPGQQLCWRFLFKHANAIFAHDPGLQLRTVCPRLTNKDDLVPSLPRDLCYRVFPCD